MKEKKCLYNGVEYDCKVNKGKVTLFTKNNCKGFSLAKDLLGNDIIGMYSKAVDLNEVEAVYNIVYQVEYCGNYYEVLSLCAENLKSHIVTLVSQNEEIAQKYEFVKHEQFVYYKDIKFDSSTKLKCTKQYVRNSDEFIRSEEISLENYLLNRFKTKQ